MNELTTDIIHRAVAKLKELTGCTGHYQPIADKGAPGIDGVIELHFSEGRIIKLMAEAKREVKPYHMPAFEEANKKYNKFIVIADRIYPAQRRIMREKGIAYLDTVGNMSLEKEGILLWIDGQKLADEEKPVTNRAFTKTGLKTVFYILADEKKLNLPYRELAAATGVALGNIKYIIEGLADAGFILQIGNGQKVLKNKNGLLDRWLAGYQETLKPALHLGDYDFFNKDLNSNWQMLPAENNTIAWGGEAAAELLTNYLTPQYLTLYTNYKVPIATTWKLIPKAHGRIKMYKKFWENIEWDEKRLTPPLLVYADLMLTGDPRCIEAARIIYEKYLKDEFES
ncbi:type IV toxin-antitoxin system AbiEi family antitoxin [Chitinophaga sp. XS-30]|uniref:type IV toxin-antitoxin system AbiEi family antitoxin n=1 Tax=Chitinophaga sp. XS-30 TaxID=2604421 RepID=UPI0011DDCAAA|nr:type IV toxin-antitoxin system AbiEi family antitoxin [Chitinophaga sp. XS-30]QEH40723.1 hypothetical protein FW415_07480 [Chitinophaga sp. XS-30]